MDIYDLAVKLSLINGVSGGLTMVVNQFSNLRADIRSTQTTLMSFQAALGASFEWQAGKRILHGIRDIVASGGQVLDHQALMLAAGSKQAQVIEMTATVWRQAASVMAATPESTLAAERTLLGIFGNVQKAMAGFPAFLKAEAEMTAMGRGTGAERQLAYGLKALDIQGAFINRKTGQFDVAAYEAGLHELLAPSLAIPRTPDVNQLMLFARMAGPAAQAMSFQDYARTNSEVIASMGRTGGRELQMLYKTPFGGNISKALAEELTRAGLVKPGAIHHIKGSSRDILDYHGIVGWQELTKNAADWAHDVLLSTLAKHGMQGVPGLMQALGAPAAAFALPVLRRFTADIKGPTEWLENNPEIGWDLDRVGAALGGILTVGGLRTGLAVLEKLGGAAGLGGLAGVLGLPGAGEMSAAGLKLLTGPTGLFALALGIDAFGKALPSIPQWLTHFAPKQAVDVGIAKLLKLPGALGLVFDLGGDSNQRYAREHRPPQEVIDELYRYYNDKEGRKFPAWLPDILSLPPTPPGYHRPPPLPLPPSPPPLPLPPLPSRSDVHVTVHSRINLPIPPLTETDIESMFRRAIYTHNAALLKELAAAIVRQQELELLPVIEQAITHMQADRRRRSFISHGPAHAR